MPMNLSAMGSQDQQFQGNCSWCGIYGHMARDCRKKTECLRNNKTSGWSGTGRRRQWEAWHGQGQEQKTKGKGTHHGEKVKKRFREMEEHDDTQDTQISQDCTQWTDTSWDHADNWNDAGLVAMRLEQADPAWAQAARQLAPPQPAQNRPIQRTESACQCQVEYRCASCQLVTRD